MIPHIVAGGPVIPNYGTAKGCIANNDSMFCTTWIRQHWHDTLEPAIVQHLWLTGIAVGIGFAIAFAAALIAHRYSALAAPFFRNTLAGLRSVPPDVLEAARGMGLTRSQILRRVELPLALPAISAGIRISVVTTISLATVAAYITPYGLGKPIFDGLQINYRTEYVVAGVLAIALALAADAVLVVAQRGLTPWARRRATT